MARHMAHGTEEIKLIEASNFRSKLHKKYGFENVALKKSVELTYFEMKMRVLIWFDHHIRICES